MRFAIDIEGDQPLHAQLEDSIRAAIIEGRIQPGERLPPIRQLCEMTNLAYGTVSKATRSLVKEGVLVARSGAGTRVAEPSAMPASGVLGVVSTSPLTMLSQVSPYFGAALLGIQDEMIQSGHISACDLWREDRPLWSVFGNLKRVDGMIILGAGEINGGEIENVAQAGKPVVLLGDMVELQGVPTIHSDNYGDSCRAVQRLLDMGHSQILFAGGKTRHGQVGLDRYRAFRDTMREAGIASPPEMAVWLEGEALGEHLLRLPSPPSALFIAGGIYQIAGTMKVLGEASSPLSRDLLICGWDAATVPALQHLPCLRIVQPVDALGHLAVKTLLDAMSGATIDPQSLILHAELEPHLISETGDVR